MRLFLSPDASLCLSVLALLATFSCGQAVTSSTTPSAPSTTPAPSAGVVAPLVMSFLIDGVVYVMNCNITGLNMSSCSYTQDHGLTVSRIGSTTADLPDYFLPTIVATLVLVGILMIMAVAGWIVWSKRKEGEGYQGVPSMPPPDMQPYGQPQPGYPPQPQYFGTAGRVEPPRKVIGVCLIKPCVPSEQGGMA